MPIRLDLERRWYETKLSVVVTLC